MADKANPVSQPPTAHGKRSGAARRKLKKEKQAQLHMQLAQLQLDLGPPRLPPELQLRVIQVEGELVEEPGMFNDPSRDRRAFLRKASLICSLWRIEAQRLLWDAPQLRSDAAVKSFVKSFPLANRPWTRCLDLLAPRDETLADTALVAQVIKSCSGLHKLALSNICDLDPSILYDSGLKDLTELTLAYDVGFARATRFPDRLPFTLSFLRLNFLYQLGALMPPELVIALLESVKEYAYVDVGLLADTPTPRPPRRCILATPSRPLQLQALSLGFTSTSVDLALSILPVVRQCTQLVGLIINEPHDEVFTALPSSLRRLTIRANAPTHDFIREVRLLRKGHACLADLKELVFFRWPEAHVNLWKLELECRSRGIQLSSDLY